MYTKISLQEIKYALRVPPAETSLTLYRWLRVGNFQSDAKHSLMFLKCFILRGRMILAGGLLAKSKNFMMSCVAI